MEIGVRIIFNPETGTVLNNSIGEMSGTIRNDLRPERIDFIDVYFDYSENHFNSVIDYMWM
jgi:hypothetical protein